MSETNEAEWGEWIEWNGGECPVEKGLMVGSVKG